MILLIKFILVTAGMVWILNQSKMFKPLREIVSSNRSYHELNNIQPKRSVMYRVWLFIEALFSCSGCMGYWASIPAYFFVFKGYGHELFYYQFIGSFASLLLITVYQKLNR